MPNYEFIARPYARQTSNRNFSDQRTEAASYELKLPGRDSKSRVKFTSWHNNISLSRQDFWQIKIRITRISVPKTSCRQLSRPSSNSDINLYPWESGFIDNYVGRSVCLQFDISVSQCIGRIGIRCVCHRLLSLSPSRFYSTLPKSVTNLG